GPGGARGLRGRSEPRPPDRRSRTRGGRSRARDLPEADPVRPRDAGGAGRRAPDRGSPRPDREPASPRGRGRAAPRAVSVPPLPTGFEPYVWASTAEEVARRRAARQSTRLNS